MDYKKQTQPTVLRDTSFREFWQRCQDTNTDYPGTLWLKVRMSTQGIGIEIHATDAEQPNDNNTDWIADVYVEKYEGKVIVYGWNPKAVATGDDPSLNIPLVEDIDQARKLVQDEDNSEKEKQLYGHT